MTEWALWGLVLLLQNASFTWVSRARNSRSLGYHGLAAVCSNGVWFLALGLSINKIDAAWGDLWLMAWTAGFYTLVTVAGSVGMHHLLMTRVERGSRQVG